MVKPRKSIENIKPYIPGKPIEEVAREFGLTEIIKLASNENPLGPSPLAVKAIKEHAENVHLYPDDSCFYLKEKLSEIFNYPKEGIIIGNGSVEIILQLALAFLDFEDEAIMSDVCFVMYGIATQIAGATPVKVSVNNYRHDLPSMLNAITKRTKIIFIDNPNNPLGSIVTKKELDEFIDKIPENIIIVLDEAYYEYITSPDYPDSFEYLRKKGNIVILRTFSKIYGLAGLRIGYGFAHPEIVKVISKVRLPFNVGRISQIAALAALEDENHRKRSVEINETGKQFLYKELDKMGIFYIPTHTNFILIDVRKNAKEIFMELQKKGIIVRPLGYPTTLRITIGTEEQNKKLINALKEVLSK